MSALIERSEFEHHDPNRIVIFNSSKQILLLRNQDPVTHRSQWELPAADFVEGQSERLTLAQTIEEETGLEVQGLRPFYFPARRPEDLIPNSFHSQYFSAQVAQPVAEMSIDRSLHLGWFKAGQLSSLKMDKETKQAIQIAFATSFN